MGNGCMFVPGYRSHIVWVKSAPAGTESLNVQDGTKKEKKLQESLGETKEK